MSEVERSVALVTGAARGIGAGCAQVFAREGYTTVLADKDFEDVEKLAKNLTDEGLEAQAMLCDVTDGKSISDLFEVTLDTYGRLDALINNAGTHIAGNILETTEEHWDFLLTLNLKSVFLCCKAAVPALRGSRGAIVNMASMVGLAGQRDAVAYSASKGGIIALTKSLALDHTHEGIRINCICPGNVDTPMMQEWIEQQRDPEEVRSRVYNAQPVGRLAEPVEVGRAALFLATEPFLTGVALPVEGGATLGY
jgi:NAD(P)-dependent dehydrogenase (short-subunit alcohol dehydrogenase family)